ncbi:SRPBCC family protein [Polluticoccus soli]|uniref:SRPBCC family protein n=1 Tax=Polluticoccus soli TaxID=3034150 RepID=UPI0023E2EF48|nr:SRPBCC family protein [Flavipsychrobacter sp. JY13-12]
MHKNYLFTTTWKIQAPLQDVWDAIYYSEQWPQWWKNFTSVIEIEKGDENSIGSIRTYKLKSPAIYTLRFDLLLTKRSDHSYLEGNATGQLEGIGSWKFNERDGVTEVTCVWNVATNIKWMNWLAFLLKPAFRYNHGVVMKNGARALSAKLHAPLLEVRLD